MEQLREALAEIAVMRRDGLLTDEEVRARCMPALPKLPVAQVPEGLFCNKKTQIAKKQNAIRSRWNRRRAISRRPS